MNILYYIIVIALLLLVSEILALGFIVTGLDRDKARFQMITIVTGTGYTTHESELITQHSIRRKLAEIMMIVGYVGRATIIGLVFNMVTKVSAINTIRFIIIISIVIGLLILVKSAWFTKKIEKILEKRFILKSERFKNKTVEEVLKLNEEYGVMEFLIDSRNPLVGVPLANSNLKKLEIQVLNIERGNYIESFPRKDFIFNEGNRVVVYGKIDNIKKVAIPKIS